MALAFSGVITTDIFRYVTREGVFTCMALVRNGPIISTRPWHGALRRRGQAVVHFAQLAAMGRRRFHEARPVPT